MRKWQSHTNSPLHPFQNRKCSIKFLHLYTSMIILLLYRISHAQHDNLVHKNQRKREKNKNWKLEMTERKRKIEWDKTQFFFHQFALVQTAYYACFCFGHDRIWLYFVLILIQFPATHFDQIEKPFYCLFGELIK